MEAEELERRVLERFRNKPFNGSEYYGNWPVEQPETCAEELKLLRRQRLESSTAINRRIQHLEEHLERGDVICNCGKEQ